MSEKTIDQRRAEHAWATVGLASGLEDGSEKDKFVSQVKKLPARVMTSGLGQALAFLKAKNPGSQAQNGVSLLLKRLGDWVLDKRQNPSSGHSEPADDALLTRIIQGDSDFMRRATEEVLAYMLWVGRFAEAAGLSEKEEQP